MTDNATLTVTAPALALEAAVTFDRWDADRAQWQWRIVADGAVAEGNDLRTGAGDDTPREAAALETLLTFLGAYVEAVNYERRTGAGESDNGDLFPAVLRTWAEAVDADSLTMLAEGLTERE